MTLLIKQINPWLILLAAFALTFAIYWPSLHGGYIFDDGVYFTGNPDVHVTTLHASDWIRAALNQAGTTQFRALSMLSFAANYYLTGLDPFWPKLTNVGIHLLNGLLLFLLTRELFRLWKLARKDDHHATPSTLGVIAAIIAATWLLLPINFTGVAYVAQRMEALANVFVFLGLWWYLRVRRREFASANTWFGLPASIAICTLLGYAAKESAVLLPLYAACIEFAIAGCRNSDGKFSRPVLATYTLFLALPLVAGLAWISTWVFQSHATFRSFTIAQRLLSEPRALLDYIQWTALPNINTLTFYHDDFLASKNLLDPPTTLPAILALLTLLALAIWQRKPRPLFCLGILWFFAGHMLTGTVIPLELVFEHRNYFPSSGLLLAGASLLGLETRIRLSIVRAGVVVAFIAWCSFTTFLRSKEWADPLRLAYAEAIKRPDSARAQYGLARTLIQAAGDDDKSPLLQRSMTILRANAERPTSGIAPLQALIYLDGRAHRPIDPRWWPMIVQRLGAGAPSQTDIDALVFLASCQRKGECQDEPTQTIAAFSAALTSSGDNPNLMSAYADFALTRLGDANLAIRLSRQVADDNPKVLVYRINLVKILIATGRYSEARTQLVALRAADIGNAQVSAITDLEKALVNVPINTRDDQQPAPKTPTVPASR